MRTETKQLFRTSTIYSIGNIFVKLVAFVLIPLYARKLAPNEYGVVAILELMEQLGKTIFAFGLGQSLLRFYTQYKKQNRLDSLIFTIITFVFLVNTLLLGSMYLFPRPFVQQLFSLNAETIFYFRATLLIIMFGVFQAIFITLLQAEERAFTFIIFTGINFLLLISLNIYKVGVLEQGVRGIVESKLYVAILNMIVVILYFSYRFKFRFSLNLWREITSYGMPFIFVGISLTLLTLADRYILKIFRTMAEVGIYSMAYKFGMILNMVLITPFRQAFFPLMFRLYEDQDTKNLYRNFLTYFLFLGLWFSLGLSILAKEILVLATSPKYVEGYVIIPLITFSYVLFGIRTILVNALATQKETKVVAYSTMVGALMNLLLNIVFIPIWGIMGAAVATIASYLLILLTTYFPQQKIYPVNWDWRRAGQLTVVTAVLFLTGFFFPESNLFVTLAGKLVLFGLFPILLYVIRFFQPGELRIVKSVIHSFTHKR